MRVGILTTTEVPESGGGYTFESEILQSLFKFCGKTEHKFVLATWAKEPPKHLLCEHIQIISLYRPLIQRLIDKFSHAATASLRKSNLTLLEIQRRKSLKKFILESGIDILWYLSPLGSIKTVELPYITIVWDLQHRLQPYFPEVSTQGEWDKREQLYAARLRQASVVIAGTEAGKAEIERFYQIPSERIKILPHPTPKFTLEAPSDEGKQVLAKYNIPSGYLFYPAQFWPHKNHAGLLLAIQLLRDQYNLVFPVVFVGSDKGNQQYIRRLVAELDLSTQVYFLGFVPQEDLVPLYRNAFALTYVTFFGPENMPPLEAFALGCPVVASEVSGAQEQLGDAALLVNPKEPKQIALAIKSLQDNPNLRHSLIQQALERASRFTGQDFVKGVFAILDEFEPIRRCWSSSEPHLSK